MLVISSNEFSNQQVSYLDKADTADDIEIGKEYLLAPDGDLAGAITGDELLIGIEQDIKELFRKKRLNK